MPGDSSGSGARTLSARRAASSVIATAEVIEFHARDGRELHRGTYQGCPVVVYQETLREVIRDAETNPLGWSSVVCLPGDDPAVDYPATCCETFGQAWAAACEYIGEEAPLS